MKSERTDPLRSRCIESDLPTRSQPSLSARCVFPGINGLHPAVNLAPAICRDTGAVCRRRPPVVGSSLRSGSGRGVATVQNGIRPVFSPDPPLALSRWDHPDSIRFRLVPGSASVSTLRGSAMPARSAIVRGPGRSLGWAQSRASAPSAPHFETRPRQIGVLSPLTACVQVRVCPFKSSISDATSPKHNRKRRGQLTAALLVFKIDDLIRAGDQGQPS